MDGSCRQEGSRGLSRQCAPGKPKKGVTKGIRPLLDEIALLRLALQNGRDTDDWWRHGKDPEADDEPE